VANKRQQLDEEKAESQQSTEMRQSKDSSWNS
jgi:hypothetical protein